MRKPGRTSDVRSPASGRGARVSSAPEDRAAVRPVRRTGGAINVDFEVGRDEVHAIIGPNGAGKSTFFNCLTGVLRPTSGRIIFNGENIAGLPSNAISQKGIARSYQITNVLPNASALENVRIAAQSRRHAWNMMRAPQNVRRHQREGGSRARSVGLLPRPTNLPPTCRTASSAISKSASRLATEPNLLCLDEPTAGMSAAETHETEALVSRIAKNELTILIVEHDMQVVMELCDRITVLHYGDDPGRRHAGANSEQSAGAGGLSQDMSAASPSRTACSGRRPAHLLRQEPHPAWRLAGGGAGRGRRPARPQRRRQVDHAENHHGPGAAEPGANSSCKAPPSPDLRRTNWRGSASATCRRTAASSVC